MSSKSETTYSPDKFTGAQEPCLMDLYSDPTLHAVLKRDGLPLSVLKEVVNDAKRRLAA